MRAEWRADLMAEWKDCDWAGRRVARKAVVRAAQSAVHWEWR